MSSSSPISVVKLIPNSELSASERVYPLQTGVPACHSAIKADGEKIDKSASHQGPKYAKSQKGHQPSRDEYHQNLPPQGQFHNPHAVAQEIVSTQPLFLSSQSRAQPSKARRAIVPLAAFAKSVPIATNHNRALLPLQRQANQWHLQY